MAKKLNTAGAAARISGVRGERAAARNAAALSPYGDSTKAQLSGELWRNTDKRSASKPRRLIPEGHAFL